IAARSSCSRRSPTRSCSAATRHRAEPGERTDGHRWLRPGRGGNFRGRTLTLCAGAPCLGDMSDLAGKTYVITGANSGIGKITARELARRGAHVIIASRSADKTVPVIDEIKRETGNDKVEFVALDLADLASVRRCAEELLARNIPIHGLINNAGLAGSRGLTKDGFELTFGT